ncbi:MAG TPA: Dyp-type peroxidase, partial [Candidatus Saccharimonadales bacterium]|nr:Dyp-type peroxidase [Candidatus Saccharimonadales bacterium]
MWPGEFVFGYPGQHGEAGTAGPSWARDGSFLVFRRLRQDVGAFHKFLHDTALRWKIDDPTLLGAKCVGRWPSGTPILHAPKQDKAEAALARDEAINNDFRFEGKKGEICPFGAHIRKVHPRNDESNQTHRLLRRGIPYGEASLSSPTRPYSDTVDRGLLFLAYQTSIENQFEFLQNQANSGTGNNADYDPIIGQNRQNKRKRHFRVGFIDRSENVQEEVVPIEKEWVIPTGGGYFFAPSIEALRMLVKPLPARNDSFSAPSPEALKKTFQNTRGPAPAQPEAISPEEWARVWAQAW